MTQNEPSAATANDVGSMVGASWAGTYFSSSGAVLNGMNNTWVHGAGISDGSAPSTISSRRVIVGVGLVVAIAPECGWVTGADTRGVGCGPEGPHPTMARTTAAVRTT